MDKQFWQKIKLKFTGNDRGIIPLFLFVHDLFMTLCQLKETVRDCSVVAKSNFMLWITLKNGSDKDTWQIFDLWYNGLTIHNI